jgi:predicted enzyme related to lactoylglutathione lyase
MRILSSDPVLAVHDLDREADWFMRVLGCRRSEPDPGNWVSCSAGTVTFMLGRCPDALQATDLGDHSFFAYLTVDCLDDYHARAIAEEAEILKPPTNEPWGRREMAVRTIEGFRLMLSERTGAEQAESST